MEFLVAVWESILDALVTVWDSLVGYIPNIIAALVILIIGIIIVKAIAKIVEKVISSLKVNGLVRKIDLVRKMERGDKKILISEVLAWLVKWFLYIALLVAISEILNLGQFTIFLNSIALYMPNVIIAALIIVVGLVLGDFIDGIIVQVLKGTKARLAPLVGAVAKWAIFIFAALAALIQLNVAVSLIQTLFTAVVVMIALAAGLAFGLGGRDAARDFIEKLKSDINK